MVSTTCGGLTFGSAPSYKRGVSTAPDVSEVILAKIRAGALPRPIDQSVKSYAGKGTNKTCDGCDQTVTADDIDYEVYVARNRTLRFHGACFTIWQAANAST